MSYILRYGDVGKRMVPVIAEEAGLDVIKVGADVAPKNAAFCFRWGTTSGINNDKQKVVNKISSIHTTADKKAFRMKLSPLGLAPKSWPTIEAFRNDGAEHLFPVLIRPAEHERSAGMHVCNNAWDVMEAVEKTGHDFYISQFIKKAREFRVMVVSGRIVWMIEKHPKDKNEASWGCVSDGDFDYVGWDEWPKAVVENALAAFAQSTLDFGAVDVIVDEDGNAYTCEINTAPFLTEYYAVTLGRAFRYIRKNGRDQFAIKQYTGWRDALHPAIDKRAA